jgi:hypothetical protein
MGLYGSAISIRRKREQFRKRYGDRPVNSDLTSLNRRLKVTRGSTIIGENGCTVTI